MEHNKAKIAIAMLGSIVACGEGHTEMTRRIVREAMTELEEYYGRDLNRMCDKMLGLSRWIKELILKSAPENIKEESYIQALKPTEKEKKDNILIGDSWEDTLNEAHDNLKLVIHALVETGKEREYEIQKETGCY